MSIASIPPFRDDGYLPIGLHRATEAEVTFRFGASSKRRRQLVLRLRRWLELARATKATRFLLDGSFVTAVDEPHDVDAVVLLAEDFREQIAHGIFDALELEQVVEERCPEDLFSAEDSRDWDDWEESFSRTRAAGRRKGLVEIEL